jgi:L-lactate dehydrogenase complex protein LldG
MSGAREEILARIRAALADVPAGHEVVIPRGYRRTGTRDREQTVALFLERAGDYRAAVTRCAPGQVSAAVADACRRHDVAILAAPADVAWAPEKIKLVAADGMTPAELDGVGGVLTGCALAIAETGTIVLDAGPRQGRRALTLVPDLHICVVESEQIVETVPEAVARLAPIGRERRRPLTLISGPSATSDIELTRVEGVHGPRRLEILITG